MVVRYGETKQVGYGYMFLAQEGADSGVGEFLRASRRGWQRTFEDPEKALDVLEKEVPSLDRAVERAKLESVRQLMLAPNGQLDTWCMDLDVVEMVRSRMDRYGQLRRAVSVGECLTNRHCKE